MAGRLFGLLFPADPRHFPGRRWLKMGLRAGHIACAGILLGAYVFHVDPAQRDPWLWATILSGLALVALDVHESAAFLLQVRGVVVVMKIGLLGALHWMEGGQAWILGLIVVASVVSSHASASVRYLVLFMGDRVKGSDTRG
jgi:hypothetical protein